MNSKEYWEKREAEALEIYIKDEAQYSKELDRIYADMLDGIQNEIDSFYQKYASAEGITLAEAKKRVSKLDIAKYERKAARYVKDASLDRKTNGGRTNYKGYYFGEEANEEMRLYNLTMKVNRLEMLKANIGLEAIKGHAELESFMEGILQGRTMEELERQAGILGKTVQNNAKTANAIVNGSFKVDKVGSKTTFSDRIWQYHDEMKNELSKLLSTGLIQGKNSRAIAKDLKKYWYGADPKTKGGARYCMERLMRTELARVQTEAQKQSFVRNGFEMYTFHANSGCCPLCSAKDGKHFKVKDMMPGENAPPMHPHCRCSTSAYEDSEEYEAWLDYLAGGGTTEQWSARKSVKAIERCKTVEDVEKLFKQQDWFIHGENGWRSDDGLSLAKCDLRSAKGIYTSFEQVFSKFPKLKNKFAAPNTGDLGNFVMAKCTMGSGSGAITFNTRKFRDVKVIINDFKRGTAAGFHPVANNEFLVVTHEIGHAVDDYLTIIHHVEGTTGKNGRNYVSNKIRPKIMRKCGVKNEDIRQAVSGYATESPQEWFAECFSEYVCSDNPRPVAAEFGKWFEKILEEVE